jgi:type II secretory pathway pseudopilin PulG
MQPHVNRGQGGRRPGAESGFTLIEVCIALIVMMVIALASAGLFFQSVRNNSGARSRTVALAVAQQQMEQLRNASFNSLEATVTANGGSPKVVISDGLRFTVTTGFNYTPPAPATPLAKRITLTVTPQNADGMQWANVPVTLVVDRAAPSTGLYAK